MRGDPRIDFARLLHPAGNDMHGARYLEIGMDSAKQVVGDLLASE